MPTDRGEAHDGAMRTNVHEIADGVYRLSTCVPDVAPDGFTFNQFLIDADEPLLFHCGPRALFDSVSTAARQVMPLERLRWITFGHVEADECGSMNRWLDAAPHAQVAHGALGCQVSLNDIADRPPRPLADREVLDLGGHRVRVVATPHVPHGWEAQVLYDETTSTLLCGDLFTQTGDPPALVHDVDIVAPALAAEDVFHATCLTATTATTIRDLADLAPRTLALMHGPAFAGDCVGALDALSYGYQDLFAASLDTVVAR
jgi:flavorubredoxin